MSSLFHKSRVPAVCLAISILVHILPVIVLRMFGTWNLGAPVSQASAVTVDLTDRKAPVGAPVGSEAEGANDSNSDPEEVPVAPAPLSAQQVSDSTPPEGTPPPSAQSEPADVPAEEEVKGPGTAAKGDWNAVSPDGPRHPLAGEGLQRRLRPGDFLSAQYEKLTYQVSMGGVPIGSAELEAKNETGATSITLRVRSNALISNIFPVDDVVETRHVDGRFILTTIRQQEGSFRSDEMFTINPGKKRVSWTDSLQKRSLITTVPNDQVLDTLSGIYYLRNRRLTVGKTETLQIYDSECYAEVPVEILRREELRLPNLTKVSTLVVRPLQKTAGIFRRSGEVLIWMTDDEHKVPVKIVTRIALGQVTAELVSAESRLHDDKALPGVPVAATQVRGRGSLP